ncbi:MAG: FAD:protein FMN transferase [Nitrospirota bacterium]
MNRYPLSKSIFLFFIILLTFSPYLSTYASAKVIKQYDTLMGTDIEIIVSVSDDISDKRVKDAINAALKEIKRIENLMSSWIDASEVSRINKNAGIRPVKVSKELFELISRAKKFSKITNGAFDISFAGLKGLWNFYDNKKYVPEEDEIKKVLHLVNYRNIIMENDAVFIKKGMRIDLGGIAKGYTIDRVAAILREYGIENALIKAGGDIRAEGRKDGKPWKIGIQHPRKGSKFIGIINGEDISVSTSGDYERYFMKDGKRYHHIIDPETGYPADRSQSVTILGTETVVTDALATAVFILGPEDGMKLVEQMRGIDAVIIDKNGNLSVSEGVGEFKNVE